MESGIGCGKSWNQALILESHGNVNSWCDKLIDDRQTVENSGNIRYLTDICNTALQHLLQQVCLMENEIIIYTVFCTNVPRR